MQVRPLVARIVSSRYVCATLDWWPSAKCDYKRCPWRGASMLEANLDDPLLRSAAKLLAPFYLRLGGSLSDQIVYEESTAAEGAAADGAGHCPVEGAGGGDPTQDNPNSNPNPTLDGFAKDDGVRVGFRSGCLSRRRWDQLVAFCRDVGCQLVFTLNALHGRTRTPCPGGTACRLHKPTPACCTNYTGAWDEANAGAFLRRAAALGQPLGGVGFGNEVGGEHAIEAHLAASDYAAGLDRLRQLLQTLWPPPHTPLLLGPNALWDPVWFRELLRAAPWLPALSYHLYPLGAGNGTARDVASKVLRADFLDKLKPLAAGVAAAHASLASAGTGVWVPELGGAYNSGRPKVTDSFVSSFWYLDSLGVLALAGTQVVCRQTLLGGSYGLVELGGPPEAGGGGPPPRRLNSDMYAATLWRRLMGPRVLSVHVRADEVEEGSKGGEKAGNAKERAAARAAARKGVLSLRLYASCTGTAAGLPAGSITLLALNLRSEPVAFPVELLLSRYVAPKPGAADACQGPPLPPTPSATRTWWRDATTAQAGAAERGGAWADCALRCSLAGGCAAFSHEEAQPADAAAGFAATPALCLLHAPPPQEASPPDDADSDSDADAPQHSAGGGSNSGGSAGCFERVPPSRGALLQHEWRINASSTFAAEPLLNGQLLRAEQAGAGSVPSLSPRVVPPPADEASPLLSVGPLSVNFFAFPNARLPLCLQRLETGQHT